VSPHRPREDGLAHPADTSRSNLASSLGLLSTCFPNKPSPWRRALYTHAQPLPLDVEAADVCRLPLSLLPALTRVWRGFSQSRQSLSVVDLRLYQGRCVAWAL
jgi:hypothetical protein